MDKLNTDLSSPKSLSPTIDHVHGSSSSEFLEPSARSLGEQITALSSRMEKRIQTRRDYIEAHPIQSITLAAAGGMVLGCVATLLAKHK